jgi:hypothetical protein
MNREPIKVSKNRPKENGPSRSAKTDPINTGVTDAVKEYGRVASIQIANRFGRGPAVSVCSAVIVRFLLRHYGAHAPEVKGAEALGSRVETLRA